MEQTIRRYLAEHPGTRAIDVARALGCTEAEALSALSEAVWEIPVRDLSRVLAEIAAWGKVMVLVRNGDAVAEVQVLAAEGVVRGDWLNWIAEGYNLHIRVNAARRILGLIRSGRRSATYSLNLVDQDGQVTCRFYTRTLAASQRFLAFCNTYEPLVGED